MADCLSESDRARITEFVNTPRYQRSPDQLLPEDEESDAASDRGPQNE
ncbi:hypothetical protein [Haloglomus litoreum]|nr:hypothetical protein [Haloglomus sp. DT116]